MCALFSRKPTRFDVLVAGAGPVGMFMALRLAQRGLKVGIVEQADSPASHAYALALQPEALALFQRANLGNITRSARLVPQVAFYAGHDRKAVVPVGEPGVGIGVLGQDVIETRLASALEDAGVQILWHHRIAEVQQDGDSVHTSIQRLGPQGFAYAVVHTESVVEKTYTYESRFLIGADGHSSTVRSRLGIDFVNRGTTEYFAVAELDCIEPLRDELRIVIHDGLISALWPMPAGRCRWSFQLGEAKAQHYSRLKLRSPFDQGDEGAPSLSQAALEELVEARAPWFDVAMDNIRWRKLVRFDKRMATSYGEGRVWLVGDSAHMGLPIGVQSMNTGFFEAERLSEAIEAALRSGDTSRLPTCARAFAHEWETLLGDPAQLLPANPTPWVSEHAEQIVSCLPVAPQHLPRTIEQLCLAEEGAKTA